MDNSTQVNKFHETNCGDTVVVMPTNEARNALNSQMGDLYPQFSFNEPTVKLPTPLLDICPT